MTSGVGGYTVDPVTGALSVATGSPNAVGGLDGIPPNAIAIDPSNRFVYFATLDRVYGFTIDDTNGALTPHPTPGTFANTCWSGQGIQIVIHPSGRFLYCGDNTRTMAIDRSTGELTNLGLSKRPTSTFVAAQSTPVAAFTMGLAPDGLHPRSHLASWHS